MLRLPAWDPFLKKGISALEDVQKFALKVCIQSHGTQATMVYYASHSYHPWKRDGIKPSYATYTTLQMA